MVTALSDIITEDNLIAHLAALGIPASGLGAIGRRWGHV